MHHDFAAQRPINSVYELDKYHLYARVGTGRMWLFRFNFAMHGIICLHLL